MNITWSVTKRKINQLKEYKKNPRKISEHDFNNLVKSLKENGYHSRLLINQDNTIIGGHQRKKALLKSGYKHTDEIEVLIPNRVLSKDEFDRINIQDNLHYGEFDFEMLNNEFDASKLIEWGISDTDLLMESKKGLVDDDDIPEVGKDPISKEGDIWILGDHKLICGDATKKEDVKKLMNGQKADMVLIDPPYNVDYTGVIKVRVRIKNDKMTDENFMEFLKMAFTNCLDSSNAGAAIYIFHADTSGLTFRTAMIDAGWLMKQCLIWVKQQITFGRSDYHWQHEPILYGWSPGAPHKWYGDRKQSTVLNFDRPRVSLEHPTMKPIAILEYSLKNSSQVGNVILDLFGGSGSTLIACEKTNRKCFTMELDPKYCDVIIKRYIDFTGKNVTRQSDGMRWSQLNG